LSIFSSNITPGSTDSWAKAVSNIDSYLRSGDIRLGKTTLSYAA
jgi:hypothetical protein